MICELIDSILAFIMIFLLIIELYFKLINFFIA